MILHYQTYLIEYKRLIVFYVFKNNIISEIMKLTKNITVERQSLKPIASPDKYMIFFESIITLIYNIVFEKRQIEFLKIQMLIHVHANLQFQ